MVWDRVPIYWSSQNENHLSLKTLLRHTLLLLLPVTHPVTLSCPPLSLLTLFRCTGSLPLLLLAVTHPVTLSYPPLSLLTLFRCTGSFPLLLLAVTHPVTLSCPPLSLLTLFRSIGSLLLTMICTKGYLPRGHQFQVHLLQNDVLDSQIQITAPCGGKSSCHLHRFSATEWDFGGRAANADQAALA